MIARYIMTKAIDLMTSPTRKCQRFFIQPFFLVAEIFLKIATRGTSMQASCLIGVCICFDLRALYRVVETRFVTSLYARTPRRCRFMKFQLHWCIFV